MSKVRYLALILILFLFLTPLMAELWVDYLWFGSLGMLSVFRTVWGTKLALLVSGFLLVSIFLWVNLKLARKKVDLGEIGIKERMQGFDIFKLASLAAGLIAALILTNFWEVILKYFNSTPFDKLDPVFGNDISFYVFELPFLQLIFNFASLLVVFTLVLVLSFYLSLYYKKFRAGLEVSGIIESVKGHVLSLFALLFLLISARLYLERYSILFSEKGAVFGAAYVDVNIMLPLFLLASAVSLITGLLFLLGLKKKTIKLSLAGVVILSAIIILGQGLVFGVQSYYVEPNEFSIERQFIDRNINHTLAAYGLEDVEIKDFDARYDLTLDDIKNNTDTIDNIRLWDDRALKDTYSQLQLIRTYYDFNDVDVDRYRLGDDYKQVMLSTREMNHARLPERAKTWVNEHLVYTHGYGVALSPVGEVTIDGLPNYYVRDIPPAITDEVDDPEPLTLDNPAIYYGELTNNHILTNTDEEEFHYSDGDENVYTTYDGAGGFRIGNLLNRAILALNLADINILISGAIGSDSEIHLRRNIKDRVEKIAPFMDYDADPYPVIHDGGIKWIIDTYTTTGNYPYSEKTGDFNYVRNSVKTTLDAYDGDVTFYVVDDADPLVQTYKKIFPDIFEDFESMDSNLQEHIRYPQDLFNVQREIYKTYHMQDSRVFYNKEDQWEIPEERYRERKIEMKPYYVTMSLPGKDEVQFMKMTPFTPEGRENMIGWMGAKSDMPDYGDIVLYRFPKGRLIYGPSQIESRIDQVDEISERFSLWGQSGSRVLRGNLLVIPIENSVLYVEPVFLMAEGDAIPELRRVIVAYGDRIVMGRNLETALESIFEDVEEEIDVIEEDIDDPIIDEPIDDEILNSIKESYDRAQQYLREGDLEAYAREIEKIGDILEGL